MSGKLQLLAAANATTSAPTLVTDGFPLGRGQKPGTDISPGFDLGCIGDVSLEVFADSGTPTFQGVLWLYSDVTAKWHVAGIAPAGGADSDRGKLNNAVTIDLTRPFAQIIGEVAHFTRAYLQVTTLSGNTVSAWLVERGV